MTDHVTIETLRKRADFVRAAQKGEKWVTRNLVVQAFKRPPLKPDEIQKNKKQHGNNIRVGFTASKKTGNAIRRNRIKRRMRAIVRDILPQAQETAAGYDIVLIGRYKAATDEFERLLRDFTTALHKLGLSDKGQKK